MFDPAPTVTGLRPSNLWRPTCFISFVNLAYLTRVLFYLGTRLYISALSAPNENKGKIWTER